jgi:hypothetical protein
MTDQEKASKIQTHQISIYNSYLKAFDAALEYYNETSHHQANIVSKKLKDEFTTFTLEIEQGATNKLFLFELGRFYEKFIASFEV